LGVPQKAPRLCRWRAAFHAENQRCLPPRCALSWAVEFMDL